MFCFMSLVFCFFLVQGTHDSGVDACIHDVRLTHSLLFLSVLGAHDSGVEGGNGCSCDRIKSTFLARLRAGIERERPGIEQRLRERMDAEEAKKRTLWDKMTEGAEDGGFSFGF